MGKIKPRARAWAEAGKGSRPKMAVDPAGTPFGTDDPIAEGTRVNEAISVLRGRLWCIEVDCMSFDGGVLIRDGKVYRVIDYNGVTYRGASTPTVAIKAFDRGMTL